MKTIKYYLSIVIGLILVLGGSLNADVTRIQKKPTVQTKRKLQKISHIQVKKLFDTIQPPEKRSGTSGLAAVKINGGSKRIWGVAMNDGVGKSDTAWGGFSTTGFEVQQGIKIENVRLQVIVEVHHVLRWVQFRLETGPDGIPLDIQKLNITTPGTYTLTSKRFTMNPGHIYGGLTYLSVSDPPLNKTASFSATIKGINWLF